MRDDFGNRFNERWERRKQKWDERMQRRNKNSHVWTGIFILLVGAALLIRTTNPDLPNWIFSWKTFLIGVGILSGIKHNFKGGAWFIMILVGGAFLITDINPELTIRQYIWPIIIMIFGAMVIFRPRHRHNWKLQEDQKKNASSGIDQTTIIDDSYDTKEDYVDSTSVFGGTKKNIISKNFKGGDLVSIFGGTELDLTRADFTGTAKLDITTIFGGTKLIIPSNWTIRSEVVTIFGGLEDKRNMQTISDNPEKVLILDGTVIFGGIEIKSY